MTNSSLKDIKSEYKKNPVNLKSCPEKSYHLFFRNLANPLKINILTLLRKSPKSVNEISQELKQEQSKISHSLATLNKCHIVEVQQKGKNRIYNLNKNTIIPILNIIDNHKCKYCESRKNKIK
ncbi:MAG: ArsR/SmtB family transcription factor [Nanoarchaeota archaeon]